MKYLATLFITGLLAWSTSSLALGLGNIELYSLLGEKLQAEMPIIGMGSLKSEDLIVGIASPATYEKLDIDYQPSHAILRFDIKTNEKNEAVLLITSTHVIKEPYLHFLIEIKYPDGNVIKDVSLLLDTPK